MSGIKLPGNLHARRVKYRDPADQLVEVDRQLLRQRILDALAPGPSPTWELRETLHVPEGLISRELTALRSAGLVKNFGRQQLRRKWALASYELPPSPPPSTDGDTIVYGRKPAPSKDSWWTRPQLVEDRKEFQARAARRADG